MTLLLVAAIGVFAAQFMKGVTGFGGSLVAVTVLASVYPQGDAMFLAAFTNLVASAYLLYTVWRWLRWRFIGLLFPPILAGQWVGTELLTVLPATATLWVLAIAVTALGIDIGLRPIREGVGELEDLPEDCTRLYAGGVVASLLGGVMAGLMAAVGPPIVAYLRTWFRPTFFRAQLIGIFALSSGALCIMLLAKGLVGPGIVGRATVLTLPCLVGSMAGARVTDRLPRVTFTRAVGAVLALSGVALVAL